MNTLCKIKDAEMEDVPLIDLAIKEGSLTEEICKVGFTQIHF